MESIEQRIVGHWPHWFDGIRGQLARRLPRGLSRFARIDAREAA